MWSELNSSSFLLVRWVGGWLGWLEIKANSAPNWGWGWAWQYFLNRSIHLQYSGGYILQNKYGFRLERYSHILIWCGRIFIKGRTCNRKCRKECSFTKLVYPFNNEMIWFVILMHQKPFLSLKTSLFQVYGNIEIVEGYSSQTYSGGT